MQPKSFFRFSAVAATLTLAAAGSFAAQNFGEAYPYESAATMSQSQPAPVAKSEPMTRHDVRSELADAREAGAVPMFGEAGDTERVIAARDRMNEAQAVAIAEQYAAEYEQQLALQQAEELRAQIEADEQAQLALANADVYEVYSVYLVETGE